MLTFNPHKDMTKLTSLYATVDFELSLFSTERQTI